VTPKGLQSFNTTEKAEVVRALGHVIQHCGATIAGMAVKAGATIPVAYAIDQMASVRLAEIAESYLEGRGVAGISLIETFTSRETEADWSTLAQSVGATFDEDACESYLHETGHFSPTADN